MKIRFQCFLVTAQTLHMGKAAEILFLSQQAISEQIKRLEKEYDTTLFYRKPKLSLTPSGMILLEAIEKIAVIEANLKHELNSIANDSEGRIRFGIGTYRLHDAILGIILDFHQHYPKVKIDLLYDDNVQLEKLLLNGKIDLFTGFNTPSHSEFEKTTLLEDENCLLIPEKLLHSFYGESEIKEISQKGIYIKEIERLPFLANYLEGALWKSYQRELDQKEIKLNVVFSSNDMTDLIHLCSLNYGAAFCPSSLDKTILHYNLSTNRNNKLELIPIVDLALVNKVEMVNHKRIFKSSYLSHFINLIQTSRLTSSLTGE